MATNETTTNASRRQLRKVDGHLSGAETDAHAVEDTADDEHGNVLDSASEDGADNPEDASEEDGVTTTEAVRDDTGEERGEERTTSHGSGDTTLDIGTRTDVAKCTRTVGAFDSVPVVTKVDQIVGRRDDSTHTTNIESEEQTSGTG